jgi:hypothetical protein
MMLAARERVIGKCSVWAHEYVIFDDDAVPYLNATFNCDAVSNYHIVLDKRVVTDITILADHGAWQHVRVSPNSCVGAYAL